MHFWTGPLQKDYGLWKAGEIPGENAIDTKVADWDSPLRMNITMRAEDSLANLKIYNSTFGDNNLTQFEIVNGDNSGTWDLKNNAFLYSKPLVAGHASNSER